MSKIMEWAQEWLDNCGDELGYNMKLMPKMEHIKIVSIHKIPVWKYMGYKTEKGFYSTTGKIMPFKSIKEVIEEYKMGEKEYWEGKIKSNMEGTI